MAVLKVNHLTGLGPPFLRSEKLQSMPCHDRMHLCQGRVRVAGRKSSDTIRLRCVGSLRLACPPRSLSRALYPASTQVRPLPLRWHALDCDRHFGRGPEHESIAGQVIEPSPLAF
jgi:hypothetical protein